MRITTACSVSESVIKTNTLRRLALPLLVPYELSYHTFETFEPILVEVPLSERVIGWGEGHISPGHTFETIDGGWAFCGDYAHSAIGKKVTEARDAILGCVSVSPVAASALVTAF